MVQFTAVEYAEMVEVYGLAGGNGAEAVRLYAERHPERRLPNARTFRDAFQRMREGNVLPRRGGEGRPIRPRRVLLEEQVLDQVDESPSISIRVVARTLGTNPSAVHRILKGEHLHPFKYTPVQELKPGDHQKRLAFCRWILEEAQDPLFLSNICWTDEKLFTRRGITNQHNEHHWAVDNPRLQKVNNFQGRWNSLNIWGAILGDAVHIFELPGHLTGEHYLQFLQAHLVEVVGDGPGDRHVWFQQDGAPPHTSGPVIDQLNQWFPDRWIGNRNDRDRRGLRHPPVAWPPRSPDLTPLDFFLWGYLEQEIYKHQPRNQEELVALMHAAVTSITPEMLQNIRRSITERARLCIDVGGGHFEQIR